MALYHANIRTLSRGSRNTVRALAYRSGTKLVDDRTAETFDYSSKDVAHVDFLIPEGSPEWAQKLKTLIQSDKSTGVQYLSDLAEKAEKRIDARVYKDFEFALPRELSDEQNIALAKEFLQDQFCQRGIPLLANFHFDSDPKTGEKKPHCHAILLTREVSENGLAKYKNRDWNRQELLQEWREQLAAYTNFHLALHGHEARVDHRSYEERGIHIEPQPKLSRGVQEMQSRGRNTDKGKDYQHVRLRNIYRLMKNPELVFDIATKNHATFMWGDVQQVLGRYIDDPAVFQAMNAKLLASQANYWPLKN